MESLEDIFLGAIEIADESARAAYLTAACGSDAELLRQVHSMLEDKEKSDRFFDSMEGPPLSISNPLEPPGTIIGRYTLLQKIGEGGMGVVYLAEQREPVVRKVALKIVKAGMDTHQVVARFEAERQALALMDHPNIATVFDGGSTMPSSGGFVSAVRPYFVMELVQGRPIHQFCDESSLTTKERLELFLDVCSAVQHAHQKGIIHRDLKPSNILIALHDDKPVPKVIDFGIAKAMQQRLTDKTVITHVLQFIGTPAYMSPEQANLNGLYTDTRSDIYALGVLLYELLTGVTPFDGSKLLESGFDEMRRTIQEQDPPRPSTRLRMLSTDELNTTAQRRSIQATHLIKSLHGDLDWIVMKCLEKDRSRRYETANGLAADILRHLNNDLITARPPSVGYRLQKTIRRNKFTFASGLAVALALIGGMIATSWQAAKAKQSAARAKEQSETARTVKNFLIDQLLGRASSIAGAKYDATNYVLADRVAREVEGKFKDQPLVEADVRHALGDAFSGFDDFYRAVEQYKYAFDLRNAALGTAHNDTLLTAAALSSSFHHVGRHRAAEALLDEAIAIVRGPPRLASEGAASVLGTRGQHLTRDQRASEAMPFLEESLELYRATVGENHESVTLSLWYISATSAFLNPSEKAERFWEENLRRCQRLHGPNHPWTSIYLKAYAVTLIRQQRPDEAIEKLNQAVAIQRETLGPEHMLTLESEGWRAEALKNKGNIQKGSELYVDLHRRWRKHLPLDNARRKCRTFSQFFVEHEHFTEAKAVYADLVTAFRAAPPEEPEDFELYLKALAATEGWSAAADFCRTNSAPVNDGVHAWLAKARIHLYAGDVDAYKLAVAAPLTNAAFAKNAVDAKTLLEIASLAPFQLQREQIDSLERALTIVEKSLSGATANHRSEANRALGAMQLRLGRLPQSLAHLDSALTNSMTDLDRAQTLHFKAICLHHLGSHKDAQVTFDYASALLRPRLLDRLGQIEAFLDFSQQTCLIQRQELAGLLGAR